MGNTSGILALWFPVGSHVGKHSCKQRDMEKDAQERDARVFLLWCCLQTCILQLPVSMAFLPTGVIWALNPSPHTPGQHTLPVQSLLRSLTILCLCKFLPCVPAGPPIDLAMNADKHIRKLVRQNQLDEGQEGALWKTTRMKVRMEHSGTL